MANDGFELDLVVLEATALSSVPQQLLFLPLRLRPLT